MGEEERKENEAEAIAIAAALLLLFNKLGSTKHPRGSIMKAYRRARLAFKSQTTTGEAGLILDQLMSDSTAALFQQLDAAYNMGIKSATRQLKTYGIKATATAGAGHSVKFQALEAIQGVINAQRKKILAALATNQRQLILGGPSRVGLLGPAPTITEARRWMTAVKHNALVDTVQETAEITGKVFYKQAVALLDDVTTETCQNVNGQIVPLTGLFILTGNPRFADRMESPQFHYNCRTEIAIIDSDSIPKE